MRYIIPLIVLAVARAIHVNRTIKDAERARMWHLEKLAQFVLEQVEEIRAQDEVANQIADGRKIEDIPESDMRILEYIVKKRDALAKVLEDQVIPELFSMGAKDVIVQGNSVILIFRDGSGMTFRIEDD